MTWTHSNIAWLNTDICLHVVNFHHLQTSLARELIQLANFLNVLELSQEHLDCIQVNSEGSFKRKPGGKPTDIFTAEMNRTIDNAIMNVTHHLKKVVGDWHWN